ncbi:LysR family transcriptional regulator [Pseudomonas protegens]|uniref:LysR family transcriptional regulator n=1 Tax=Pseudomonas protegens TaxID=380021 RepID=UPI000F4C3093|nr:LysR family transcriptional regulator [Pseudomonas protegens]ROL65708.1 LysR family transcriptional regulator [Pseudomonas protegens]
MLTQLRDMDLQLLRLFVTIVECGGFSAAQGKLGIAQSTISTKMAKLEVRLGVRLCERGKGGFRLTPKGAQILQSARRLFEALDEFTRDTQDVSHIILGELQIGISELLASTITESIGLTLGAFRNRAKDVTIEIISAPPAELERLLVNNTIQLAISYFSGNQEALNYEPLFTERQTLFCGEAHPFFHKAPQNIEELNTSSKVTQLYKTASLSSRIQSHRHTAVSDQVDADLIFVLSGAHISFLPTHIAKPWVTAGKLRALFEDSLSYDVIFQLATSKSREPSEALAVFKQQLIQQFDAAEN